MCYPSTRLHSEMETQLNVETNSQVQLTIPHEKSLPEPAGRDIYAAYTV